MLLDDKNNCNLIKILKKENDLKQEEEKSNTDKLVLRNDPITPKQGRCC